MCIFPNINFVNQIPPLPRPEDRMPSRVQSMITLLNRININPDTNGLTNINQLEARIIQRINEVDEGLPGDQLVNIFHLIQIWGGSSGRSIYVRNGGFANNFDITSYISLVHSCININSTPNDIYNETTNFNTSNNCIGVSFITKHIRFWSMKVFHDNALPIYDNFMAKNVMQQSSANFADLLSYWEGMTQKAIELRISISALERQLFIYFQNNN